jgi:phosphohistidine phosphatase
MKTLLLLRHAKSSWDQPEIQDHSRPLNKRGKHDAPLVGKLLREQGLVPDLIISSTARRAEDTARLVAEACGYEGEVETCQELYLSDPTCYMDILHNLPDAVSCVLMVGHNPDLQELLSLLADYEEPFPTAALAQVELPISSWQSLNEATDGYVKNIWKPRDL